MAFLDSTGITRLVTDLRARFAALVHTHSASTDLTGQVPLANGGTGASTAAAARTALDAAQSNGATNTLYAAEQAIAQNASDISTLQDSVCKTVLSGVVDSGSPVTFTLPRDSCMYLILTGQQWNTGTYGAWLVYASVGSSTNYLTIASNNSVNMTRTGLSITLTNSQNTTLYRVILIPYAT